MNPLKKIPSSTAIYQIALVIILAAFAWRVFSSDIVSIKTPLFELKTESRMVKP